MLRAILAKFQEEVVRRVPQASTRFFAIFFAGLAALLLALAWQPGAAAQIHSRSHASFSGHPPSTSILKAYGTPSAPIRLDVFSDYQCPSCGNFFENTMRPMINEYVAQGKVYIVHHDFPLQMHPYSGAAARWANAAAKIGEFQQVDAALFDNQAAWGATGDIAKYVLAAIGPADFKRVEAILKPCTSPPPTSHADGSMPQADPACPVDASIVQDVALGYQIPVRATPTYVISYKGQKFPPGSGAVSWDIMRQFFDSLLSQ